MPTSAATISRDYFKALAARDLDAAMAYIDDDGVEDMLGIGILRGPAEIREFFEGMFAALPDFEMVVEHITAQKDFAAVQWRGSGTFTGGPFQGVEPNGSLVDLRGCDVIQVQDGKIVRNTVYQDGMQFARAVGLLPPAGSPTEKALFGAFNAATKLKQTVSDRLAR
jgi:steroid delta-isomerase-like uncharacterized protein